MPADRHRQKASDRRCAAPARRPGYGAVAAARARGLTLIEIIVVLAIIAIVMGVAVAGSMQLPSARLRKTATLIASAIKVGYTRATSTSRDLRLVMDLEQQKIWLEETDVPMLVQSKDTTSTGGAEAGDRGGARGARRRADKIVKGPAHPEAELPRARHLRLRRRRGGQGRQAAAARHPLPPGADGARRRGRAPRGAPTCTSGPEASPSARRSSSGSASPRRTTRR